MPVPSYCHARLPHAGLGNKLLVWAKALVFSRLNGLPLVVTGWYRLQKVGLTQGGDFRFYGNVFEPTDEVGWFTRWRSRRQSVLVKDPLVAKTSIDQEGAIYEFSTVPHWSDYFGAFREHRDEVRQALFSLLTPSFRREVEGVPGAPVGLHIRCGDFRKLQPSEDFANVGNVRTPAEYFVDLIDKMRAAHGSTLPVQITTDGTRSDVEALLSIPRTSLSPRRSGIVDLLAISKSRVLITSAGSTFSYWAGFLGDLALIHHPAHVHALVRPMSVNQSYYEGPLPGGVQDWPPLFLQNLRAIQPED